MNRLRQMEIANQVLDNIYPIDPFAIVAGGAPRDWYFGNQASDLDVYFYAPTLNTLHITMSVFSHQGLSISDVTNTHPLYNRNPDIRKVYISNVAGMDVHFIQMNKSTHKCVVQSFALNICSIYYKNREIIPTRDFLRAIKHKAIVKINTLYSDGDKYIGKIKNKFPDYKYYPSYEFLAQDLLDGHND